MAHEQDGDLGAAWLQTKSAGSGPFRLRSWQANESVVLGRESPLSPRRAGCAARRRGILARAPSTATRAAHLIYLAANQRSASRRWCRRCATRSTTTAWRTRFWPVSLSYTRRFGRAACGRPTPRRRTDATLRGRWPTRMAGHGDGALPRIDTLTSPPFPTKSAGSGPFRLRRGESVRDHVPARPSQMARMRRTHAARAVVTGVRAGPELGTARVTKRAAAELRPRADPRGRPITSTRTPTRTPSRATPTTARRRT